MTVQEKLELIKLTSQLHTGVSKGSKIHTVSENVLINIYNNIFETEGLFTQPPVMTELPKEVLAEVKV